MPVTRKEIPMDGSTTDKLSGKAKQAAGKVTDDKKLQAEGHAEEAKGTLKDKLNDVVDTVSEKVDDVKEKFDRK